MNGLFVDTISYGEVNAINAFIMLVFGLCGIAFLKRLHDFSIDKIDLEKIDMREKMLKEV